MFGSIGDGDFEVRDGLARAISAAGDECSVKALPPRVIRRTMSQQVGQARV